MYIKLFQNYIMDRGDCNELCLKFMAWFRIEIRIYFVKSYGTLGRFFLSGLLKTDYENTIGRTRDTDGRAGSLPSLWRSFTAHPRCTVSAECIIICYSHERNLQDFTKRAYLSFTYYVLLATALNQG